MKKYLVFCSTLFLLVSSISCSKVEDSNLNKGGEPFIQGFFKERIPQITSFTPEEAKILYATEEKAIFSTLYENGQLDIQSVSKLGEFTTLATIQELNNFNFKIEERGLENLYTVDTDGNFYTVINNSNQPDIKTVWKYDVNTKTTQAFAQVANANLKKIFFWAQQNKLIIQDDSTIYTLGLDNTTATLEFLIGGPNSNNSLPKDGEGSDATVNLNFPLSTFDTKFYYLENNQYLREVSLVENQASVSTISAFEKDSYNTLKMLNENQFFINRRNPDVGLSGGDFKTKNIFSYFFMSGRYYGYPIRFYNGIEEEVLVHYGLVEVLGGQFNNKNLTTLRNYYPVKKIFWATDNRNIILVEDFSYQIINTRRIKL